MLFIDTWKGMICSVIMVYLWICFLSFPFKLPMWVLFHQIHDNYCDIYRYVLSTNVYINEIKYKIGTRCGIEYPSLACKFE